MKNNTPSKTAELAAVMRAAAVKSKQLKNVVNDPYAVVFCGFRTLPALFFNKLLILFDNSLTKINLPVIQAGVLCALVRHRFIEDHLNKLIKQGIRQVILLGAGYDTKAIRLIKDGMIFIEIDHPATQNRKRAILDKKGISIPYCHFIPSDLSVQFSCSSLESAGFDRKLPVAVIAEGVFSYFTSDKINSLINEIGQLSNEVHLIFDYRHPVISKVHPANRWYSHFKGMGEKYLGLMTKSGMNEILDRSNFETLSADDLCGLSKNYGIAFSRPYLNNTSEVRITVKRQAGNA